MRKMPPDRPPYTVAHQVLVQLVHRGFFRGVMTTAATLADGDDVRDVLFGRCMPIDRIPRSEAGRKVCVDV